MPYTIVSLKPFKNLYCGKDLLFSKKVGSTATTYIKRSPPGSEKREWNKPNLLHCCSSVILEDINVEKSNKFQMKIYSTLEYSLFLIQQHKCIQYITEIILKYQYHLPLLQGFFNLFEQEHLIKLLIPRLEE